MDFRSRAYEAWGCGYQPHHRQTYLNAMVIATHHLLFAIIIQTYVADNGYARTEETRGMKMQRSSRHDSATELREECTVSGSHSGI